jgi:hypothetical protein
VAQRNPTARVEFRGPAPTPIAGHPKPGAHRIIPYSRFKESRMATKLTKPQHMVMNQMNKGWKAYVAHGKRVEINGRPVCTTDTMAALEKAGLVEKIGVAAWGATEAGRQWVAPASSLK